MTAPSPTCKRCGRCCQSSTPTLHLSDIDLVKSHYIGWADLYTVRKGERVWDNISNKPMEAPGELIKIRENSNGACVYYNADEKTCTIYPHRPAECVALFCEDTTEFFEVYHSPRLTRKDVIPEPWLQRLVEEQESRCPYGGLALWISRIGSEGEAAVDKVIQLLRFDHEIRRLVQVRLSMPTSYMDLLFGRPMMDTLHVFGLKVIKQSDGSFFLTIDK